MSALSRTVGRLVGEPIALLDQKIKDNKIERFTNRTHNLTKDELSELSKFIADNQVTIQAAKDLPRPEFIHRVGRCRKTGPMIHFLTQPENTHAIQQRIDQIDQMKKEIIAVRREIVSIPNYQELNAEIALQAPAIVGVGTNLSIEEKIKILEEMQIRQVEGFLDTQENGNFIITSQNPGVQLHIAIVSLRDFISNNSDMLAILQEIRRENPEEYKRIMDEIPDGKTIIDFLTGSLNNDPFLTMSESELQIAREKARDQFEEFFQANAYSVQGQHRVFETYQNTIHLIESRQYAIELTRDPGAVKEPEKRLQEEYMKAKEDFPLHMQFVEPYFIKRGLPSQPYLEFAKAQFIADYHRVDEIVLDGTRILTPGGQKKQSKQLEAKVGESSREVATGSPDRLSDQSEASETIAESSSNSDKEKTESPDRLSGKAEVSDSEDLMSVEFQDWPPEKVFNMVVSSLKSTKRGSREKPLTNLQLAELFLASTQAAEDKTQFFCMGLKRYLPIIAAGHECSIKVIIDTESGTVVRESATKSAMPHPEATDEEGKPLPPIINTGDIKMTNTFYYRTGHYQISFARFHDEKGNFLGLKGVEMETSGRYSSDGEIESQEPNISYAGDM